MNLSAAVRSHDATVQPKFHWLLSGAALLGMYHVLLRVGRWAERQGTTNVLTRRCAVFAWLFPVAFPAFVVWNALTG